MLLIVSNTLGENLPCNDCEKGLFIKRTCIATKYEIQGTQCELCSKCDGEGQRILANCTRDSDTRCGCEEGYVQTTNSSCQKEMTAPTSTVVTPMLTQRSIYMIAAVPVIIVFLIVLAVSVLFGARVSLKSGEKLLENSATATSDII